MVLGSPEDLKKRVGGDIINLQTRDNKRAEEFVKRVYGYDVSNSGGAISFEVERGEEFLPSFIKSTDFEINSVGVRRPTLEDVFLKLTGHAIREESADGMETIRAHVRMKRRG